ncbi:MAG: hypothetical protein V1821_02465, partial [bacterium]
IILDHLEIFAKTTNWQSGSEQQFEQSMQTLNEILDNWLREHPGGIDLAKSGLTVFLLVNRSLTMTGFGPIFSIFLHEHKNGVEQYDLLKDFREERAPDPSKVLRSVVIGELDPGDMALVGNAALFRLFDEAKLKEILTSLPAPSAAEQLKLQAADAMAGVSALVLKCTKNQPLIQHNAKSSVEDLYHAESRTADVLTRSSEARAKQIKKAFKFIIQVAFVVVIALYLILKTLARLAVPAVVTLINLIRGPKESRKEYRHKFKKKAADILHDLKIGLLKFPKAVWITAVVLIAIIVALIGLSVSHNLKTQVAEQNAARQTAIVSIKNLLNDADARLIFDEVGARTKLAEAKRVLELNKALIEGSDEARQFEEQIKKIASELRKEFALQVETLHTLPEPGLRVLLWNSRLYAVTGAGNLFEGSNKVASVGKKLLLAMSADDALYLIDEGGLTTKVNSKYATDTVGGAISPSYKDAVIYNSRLYALSISEGTIVRQDITGSGWGGPRNWLTASDDKLKTARTLSIDAEIFVGTASEILRYNRGTKQDWKVGIVEPSLKNITRIWTSADSSNLYVLEAEPNRLVIFNKSIGALIKQYSFPDFVGVSDFAVDEKAKTLYLLSGNLVGKTALE